MGAKEKTGCRLPKVLKLLDNYLAKLDLQVKAVSDKGQPITLENIKLEQLDRVIYYVTLRDELTPTETKMMELANRR